MPLDSEEKERIEEVIKALRYIQNGYEDLSADDSGAINDLFKKIKSIFNREKK